MNKLLLLLGFFLLCLITPGYAQLNPILGESGSFGVLASTSINNTGVSTVQGNLGISPGDQIINSGVLTQTGTRHLGNVTAADAKESARVAFENHKTRPVTRVLPNQIGNGETLTPGVYRINGNANLSGVLVLNGAGNPNAMFVFVVEDGNFTTAATTAALPLTRVDLESLNADNIYWVIEGSATIGTANVFAGNILARQSVALQTGVTMVGRAVSLTSNVSLNTSTIMLPGVVQADLSVQKTKVTAATSYTLGDEVTYRVTVRNNGPEPAATVRVTENFPDELEFVRATPAKGSYNQAAKEWQIGAMASGEEVTMDIVFRVAAAGSNIVNRVTVDSATPDTNTANNQASSEPINAACAAPNLTITGQTDICLPQTGNLTYSVTAVAGATYNFTLPGGWTPVAQTGNSILVTAGTSGGQLSVTVTDACGNTYSATKTINVLTSPDAPVITGSATVCANSESTYTATGVSGNVTYSWIGTGGLTIVSSSGNTALVRAGSTGGSLTVKALSSTCDGTASAPFAVAVTPAPATPGTITGAATVCTNLEQTYAVTPVTGATAYVWTVPDGWQIIGATGTTATTTVPEIRVRPGTASGNITVRSQNQANCQSGAATRVVTVSPGAPATPGAITASTGACTGTQVTYTVAAVPNATSYVWNLPTGWNAGNNTTTATTTAPSLTVTVGAGTGSVRVKAANACDESQESALAVPAVAAPAAVGTISGPAEVCAATGNIQYSINPVAGATTYTWAPLPAGWTITSGAGTTNITVTTGTATGNVQLRVVASNACGSTNAATTVTVRAGLPVAGGITDNSSFCEGLSYSISAVAGAASYTWAVPAGFIITAGQGTTSIRVQQTTPGATGQVTVAANNGFCDGPVASATIDVSLLEGDLNFPKAFSPNGDGINDTWLVTNLTRYTDNDIIIFNRWGTEVFRKSNYRNDWAGTGLEQGTYFYKARVRQCDGSNKDFTGYVSIYR